MYTADLLIKEFADIIRGKIENCVIYGKTIDMNNIDHLIVAAYFSGDFDRRMYWSKVEEEKKELGI